MTAVASSVDPLAVPAADEPGRDFSAYVAPAADGGNALLLSVDGISCGACVWRIESALAREPGLRSARVNMTTRRLALNWRGPAADANRFAARVAALGFPVSPAQAASDGDAGSREKELLRAMAVAGFAAGNIMLLSVSVWSGGAGMGAATRDLLHWLSALIALPAVAYAGLPFFRSAAAALSAGRTNMDVPISIGVLLAVGVSLAETASSGHHAYFDSAVVLLFFLLIGRYLDLRSRGRARSAAAHLLAMRQAPVTILRPDGTTRAVPPDAVRPGDVALVAAGERIAVDGTVADGRSDIDASLVTGESRPVGAAPGTALFAGSVNLTGPLRIAVTATGDFTLLAEIARLVEAAEQNRGRFVVLADRVARLYAPAVHLLAALTFAGWAAAGIGWQPSLLNAIAVLIVTCPCALALAVPVVQVVATGRLLRRGILLKSGTALERLARIDTVVFDKTGTLTLGRPVLKDAAHIPPDALAAAARLAKASRHPLARAVAALAPDMPVAAGVVEHPGQGLSLRDAAGETRLGSRAFCGVTCTAAEDGPELWLAAPGRAPVHFTFADAVRADAGAVIASLRARGLGVEILSGDRPEAVAAVAAAVGIADWRAGCTPAGKRDRLAALEAAGRRVLMVGDGLNDAPALAAADVSISPATAADVSQTAADVVFQGDALSPVEEVLGMARQSQAVVRQNLAIAILYNVFAVPLAMAGLVTPLIAAIAMSASSILVVANAVRPRRMKGWRR